jgi:predicted permease
MYCRPPRLAEWLIATRVWPDERATVLGDADEMFQEHVKASGEWRGAWWYWRHAIALAWGLWWWKPRRARQVFSRGGVMAMDDVRYAARRLRKQPLASFVSVATLACAIGAAAATWSLISSLMLHPLHVKDPDRLVEVGSRRTPASAPTGGFNYPTAQILRATGLMPMAAWGSIGSSVPMLVQTTAEPRVRSLRFTSPEFLDVLGVRPALGRYISAEEDQSGAPLVAVLSERFWRSEFNADRNVIGRTIQVRDQPTRIVGVAPPNFRGLQIGRAPDLFMPLHSIDRVIPTNGLFSEKPPVSWVDLVGRLPDGVSLAEMEGRLNSLKVTWWGSTPETKFVLTDVETAAMSEGARTDLRKFATLLGSTVALLLAIGSLTVGMLLLMRTEARGGEFAMCLALGASRSRLATGVAIEGVVLAVAGTLLALPVSRLMFAGISVFRLPGDIRIDLLDLSLDGRVLVGAAAAAIASILLIAGIASLFALRRNHGDVLRSQAGATPRVTRRRSRAALVSAQVAVTLVLVTGTGLFARSISRALSLNPDFDTSRVLFGDMPDFRQYGYDGPREETFLTDFRTRLLQHPAVAAMGIRRSNSATKALRFNGADSKLASYVGLIGIDDHYLSTIGLPVLTGRAFTLEDSPQGVRVAIVSASLAKAINGNGSALGWRVAPPTGSSLRFDEALIIGVVPDIRSPGSLSPLLLYLPSRQYSPPVYPGSGGPRLVVRATGNAVDAATAVAATILEIDRALYPTPPKTLDAQILEEFAPQRFGMTVMGALGAIALILSVLGTYVIAESMAVLRRREMGIRAALGARGSQLGSLLLSDTFRLVGMGLLLGFGLAWLGAGTIRAFLFQVEPFDPFVTGGVAALIIVLALAVSLRPALAAARIDLARVLRQD